jgi:hypothetical protein
MSNSPTTTNSTTTNVEDVQNDLAIARQSLSQSITERESLSGPAKAAATKHIRKLEDKIASYEAQLADAGVEVEAPVEPVVEPPAEPLAIEDLTPGTICDSIVEHGAKVGNEYLVRALALDITALGREDVEQAMLDLGNQVVAAGLLNLYTAARYGSGDWVSKRMVKLVRKGIVALTPEPDPEPETPAEAEAVESEVTEAVASEEVAA